MPREQQNIIARGEMRKQTAVLNYVADSVTKAVDICVVYSCAVKGDVSRIRVQQPNDQAKQG